MTASAATGFQLSAAAPDTLGVSGVLSFDTAEAALQAIQSTLAEQPALARLDLAGVHHSDSAGLACVLAVLAEASRAQRALQPVNVPQGMQALARVCEVDGWTG